MSKEMPEELKMILGAIMQAAEEHEEETSGQEDVNETPSCAGCGGALSKGAGNPIMFCAVTDAEVDIVTMHQDVTTFDVSLEEGAEEFYTYKTTEDIEVGDVVLVETVHGYQTAQVEVVHDEPHFIVDGYTIRWMIGKVDMAGYEAAKKQDIALGAELSQQLERAADKSQETDYIQKLHATREDLKGFLKKAD